MAINEGNVRRKRHRLLNAGMTIICLYLPIFTGSCLDSQMNQNYTNHLAGESSLYLLQHAHNPVDWYPWSDEAWEKAKKENKLVLLSIGYSSCHWCHVMEKETFEDEETAQIMNENFVCIKIDREERPDIDQVYMNAVQLMTGSGGWPLNCFTLPDGRPIYGGTYFPRQTWQDILIKLSDFYRETPEKANAYAKELTEGIRHSELIKVERSDAKFSKDTLSAAISKWKSQLDNVEGGPNRAPKFPLPGNYQLLLRYAYTTEDKPLLDHVNLTLKKMAYGGIYDQLAGGFARYSTDARWKVPHFEKMLYDNAQLISLYASAYKLTKNELYKKIALETIDFLRTEMSDGNGGYYSAIDADSEGEEGKFYVWTMNEIKSLNLPAAGKPDPHQLVSDYFNLNENGHWENDHYILLREKTDEEIAASHNLTLEELNKFIGETKRILLEKRNQRIRPALDKKIITSWNALHLSALCEAYQAFGMEDHRTEAKKIAAAILGKMVNDKGRLIHASSKPGAADGYIEDYAFTISALCKLYQVTFDETWIMQAKALADHAIRNFYDPVNGFFWFTSRLDDALIARVKETTDNVIPASNSEMANALFILGDLYDNKEYMKIATEMLAGMTQSIAQYPSSHSNWMNLMMNLTYPYNEIVITGLNADSERKKLSHYYLPYSLFAGSNNKNTSLPILENRYINDKTFIYVCTNRTCNLPVQRASEAAKSLNIEYVN